MSLEKSRIPKISDNSKKFIPAKQKKSMNDPFVERITRTRTDKGDKRKKVCGRMIESRSQKSSEGQKTRMHGVTEKPATSSSFSERVKITFGNFFPFTMGTGTGDEAETQEEEEDDDKQDDFGSQVSLNSTTQENDAYTDRETGTMDQFSAG